jgi:hypothetical protein
VEGRRVNAIQVGSWPFAIFVGLYVSAVSQPEDVAVNTYPGPHQLGEDYSCYRAVNTGHFHHSAPTYASDDCYKSLMVGGTLRPGMSKGAWAVAVMM